MNPCGLAVLCVACLGFASANLSYNSKASRVELRLSHEAVVVAVINGERTVYATCDGGTTCLLPLEGESWTIAKGPVGSLDVAVYELRTNLSSGSGITRLGSVQVAGRVVETRSKPSTPAAAAAGWSFDAGILYEGWHGFASDAQRQIAANGSTPLAVEEVIRSNGSLVLFDMLEKYGLVAASDSFYYQGSPDPDRSGSADYYCIYTHRPNETGYIPDCAGVNATLLRHAQQLTGAGVTYVVFDGTNLGNPDREAEVIQVRPLEVAFETWAALRAQGISTPAITAWQTVVAGTTLWQNVLALYNAYPDLVYTDAASGKLVVFVPDTGSTDPTIVAALESNGGRNNVVVQGMWAEFPPSDYAKGKWGFFSPCTTAGAYDNSVVGRGRGISGCGQLVSTGGAIGASITASPAWQLGYGSVPFGSANKYDGVLFKRQFGTMFDNLADCWASHGGGGAAAAACAASGLAPPHVMLSSFNEWIAQPQPNPFNAEYSYSVGVPWDPQRTQLFVDSWGDSMSRDIEASVATGGGIFDVMASCLRVARLAGAAGAALLPSRGPGDDASARRSWLLGHFGRGVRGGDGSGPAASCAVAGEACCAFDVTADEYAVVWSLGLDSGADAMVSALYNEVQSLTQPGGGWTQYCNAFSVVSDFCVDAALTSSPLALRGPFVIRAGGCGLDVSEVTPGVNASVSLPGRAPLVRCFDGAHHYLSTDPACPPPPGSSGGGAAVPDEALGCVSVARDSNLARALRLCRAAAAAGSGGPAPLAESAPAPPEQRPLAGSSRYLGTLAPRSPHAAPRGPVAPRYPMPGAGAYYHTLDGPCGGGDADLGVLGYVR